MKGHEYVTSQWRLVTALIEAGVKIFQVKVCSSRSSGISVKEIQKVVR
jgi:hypothetical protein